MDAPLQIRQDDNAQELDSTALLKAEANGDGAEIKDIDVFCQRLYEYYVGKGLGCLIAHNLFRLSTLFFSIALTGFLMLCVDWATLLSACVSEESCQSMPSIIASPFAQEMTVYRALAFLYVWMLIIFAVVYLLNRITDIREYLEIAELLDSRLNIADDDLDGMEWSEVVERLLEYHNKCPLGSFKLSAMSIANRIMRKDNYLIAMINRGVLDLSVPLPFLSRFSLLTHTIEVNLRLIVLDAMFDRSHRIRARFIHDVAGLRQRMAWAALANLILCPFILVGLLNYMFLRYAEEVRYSPESLSRRQYSPLARWQLREFNEVPHQFQQRLNRAIPPSDIYVSLFPSPVLTSLGRFLSYVSGAVVGVLTVIGIVNNDVLLHYRLPPGENGMNLLGLFAVAMGTLTLARSVLPEAHTLTLDPREVFEEVAKHTHYNPLAWRGRHHLRRVCGEFTAIYKLKVVLFLEEILSILLTPFILWFSLPKSASEITDFVRNFTEELDEQGGDVCSFALFDFEHHGNEVYGAPAKTNPSRQTRDGKMEISYLSFKAQHPTATVPGGNTLLDNIAPREPPSLSLPPMTISPPSSPPTSPEVPRNRVPQVPKAPVRPGGASPPAVVLASSHIAHSMLGHGAMLSSYLHAGRQSNVMGESYFAWLQRYCDDRSHGVGPDPSPSPPSVAAPSPGYVAIPLPPVPRQ